MTDIARGTIKIDLDDEATIAGLRAINSEFRTTMRNIERSHATASADLDIADLQDAAANARREVKRLEGLVATVEVEAELKPLQKALAKARREVKRLDGEKAVVEIEVKGEDNVRKAVERSDKLLEASAAAQEKRDRKVERLAQQAETRRINGVRFTARVSKSLRDQQAREMKSAEAEAHRINNALDASNARAHNLRMKRLKAERDEAFAMNREFDKNHRDELAALEMESSIRRKLQAQRDKELNDLPRLQREYVELAKNIEGLAQSRRRSLGNPRQTQVIDFKIAEAEAKMRGLKTTLERIGGPIDLDINIHPGRRFGSELRAALQERSITGSAEHVGIVMGARLYTGFQNQLHERFSKRAIASLGARTVGRVGDIFGSLSAATVRLGPFTATLRQLGLVMAVLGPTILDVVGALGSLVSVAGAGLAGVATIGAGAVTGLGLSFLGLKFATRNTTQEIGNARTAINALQKAEEKHGKGSDQAKAKQKELNNTLKAISPLARETALGIEKFYADWDKRTVQTQKNLGVIAKEGFSALDAIGPQWARRTNELSGILKTGLSGAFKFIKSGTGKGLIDSIMGNFNAAIPRALHGLGALGEAFLRFAREGSKYLPMVTRGFDNLSKRILGFTQSDKFGPTVKRWVTSAQNLVRFFGAAGRVLVHFFGAGVDAGNNFVVTMTNALNRWDAFLRSGDGRKQFSDFFNQSVTGAEALWHAIAPIGAAFVLWAHNLSPIVTGFLKGAGAVTVFVGQIVKLVGLQGSLGTLAATLGALWAIGKISSATRAIIGFTQALLGLKTAETALATSSALSGVGGLTRGSPLVVSSLATSATRAAPALTRMGTASAVAGRGLAAVGAAAGFSNPYVGGAILVAGGLYVAYKLLTKGTRDAKQAMEDGGKVAKSAGDDYRNVTGSLADTATAHQRAAIQVRNARNELAHAKKGTDEAKTAQLDLNDALRYFAQTGAQTHAANETRIKDADAQVRAEQKRLDAYDKLNEGARKQAEWDQKFGQYAVERENATRKLGDIEKNRAAYVDRVNAALNRQAAVSANTARATANMTPVLGQAEQKLGALARLSKSTSVKVALKFTGAGDVGKVAASAAATLKSGVPARIVTRIVADSSSADQAIRRLQQARITDKNFAVVAAGGVGALRTLTSIAGRKLTDKEFKTVMSGGDGALRVLAKILGIRLGDKTQRILKTGDGTVLGALARILGIRFPTKTATVTANVGSALGPIGQVQFSLNGLRDRTVTVTTRLVTQGNGKVLKANAAGRGPGGTEASWVGEGRNFGGARELIANQRTGAVTAVDKPTIMNLSKDDYVIPTEPAYASKGRSLYAEWARGLGIPMFRKSKRPKLPKLISAKAADAANLKEVQLYTAKQDEEETLNKQISIKERQVKEPSTFLKPNGTDGAGNPLFTIDQQAIDTYDAQLSEVQKLQKQMVGDSAVGEAPGGLMGQLKALSVKALSALGKYRKDRKDNIDALIKSKKAAAGPAKSNDKKTAAAAKKVISDANTGIARQQGMYDTSINVSKEITDDQSDADNSRIPGYQLDLADTKLTRSTLQSHADAENAAAAPDVPKPDAPAPGVGQPGGPTVGEDKIGKLETEKSLAGIGVGVNGQAPRDLQAINNDLIQAQTERLGEGQALLNDTITSNDAEGYDIIQSAASAISGLRDEIKSASDASAATAAGVLAQQSSFSSAMIDLYKNFGSNFHSSASASAAVSNTSPFSSAPTRKPTSAASPAAGAAAAGGITLVQNFPTQPDPMTWAAATQFELSAAL